MTAAIIDGKAFAAQYKRNIARKVSAFREKHGFAPGLAVILVGDDPASDVYVRNKGKAAEECGIHSLTERLSADTTQDYLLKRIHDLNNDRQVHGILVQLPLPKQIDASAVLDAIDPRKDVDGFHVINAGRLATGQDSLVPCTPQGCLLLLEDYFKDAGSKAQEAEEKPLSSATPLQGLHTVIVGTSNIVGKPMAQLLLKAGCTVTLCHSRTRDLPGLVKQADILVVAVGKPGLIPGSWLKPGVAVIDVGINRVTLPDGKTILKGDVDFETAKEAAGAITPVPGGVGPMTIACLLANTLKAANSLSP